MHGLGNDYIYIELLNDKNILKTEDFPKLTRYMCNRNFGVGADGVIFIDNSTIADFKMIIYNKDGTEAQMCGNGIRCFAKYVYEKKLTTKKNITIETASGIKQVYLRIENKEILDITVNMGAPVFDIQKLKEMGFINDTNTNNLFIKIDNINLEITPISIGNPHAVVFVWKVDDFNVCEYGKKIENNDFFPEKTNVEFVQIIDKGHIKMRVWERGSGETYACGTGACAALAVCAKKGYTRRQATVNLKGGDLLINWNPQDNNIYMTGIATKVFDGRI